MVPHDCSQAQIGQHSTEHYEWHMKLQAIGDSLGTLFPQLLQTASVSKLVSATWELPGGIVLPA